MLTNYYELWASELSEQLVIQTCLIGIFERPTVLVVTSDRITPTNRICDQKCRSISQSTGLIFQYKITKKNYLSHISQCSHESVDQNNSANVLDKDITQIRYDYFGCVCAFARKRPELAKLISIFFCSEIRGPY